MSKFKDLKNFSLYLFAGLLFIPMMLYEKYFAEIFNKNDYDGGDELR